VHIQSGSEHKHSELTIGKKYDYENEFVNDEFR
jgi:hypothetical protein